MGNRSHLLLTTYEATTEHFMADYLCSYEYTNGLAICWPFMFTDQDVTDIDFHLDDETRRPTPIIQARIAEVRARIEAISDECIKRYGLHALTALGSFTRRAIASRCQWVILNPIEYYLFGFEGMTDRDVAMEYIEKARLRDWEYLERLATYDDVKAHGVYPFIGERG